MFMASWTAGRWSFGKQTSYIGGLTYDKSSFDIIYSAFLPSAFHEEVIQTHQSPLNFRFIHNYHCYHQTLLLSLTTHSTLLPQISTLKRHQRTLLPRRINPIPRLHPLAQMRIKMTNDLPEPRIRSGHMCGQHLAGIDWYARHHDSIMEHIVAVPVCNVGVKTHIHDVEDGGVVDAHAEGRVVRKDEAVDLGFVSYRFLSL
jgi:hypothetical protein